MIEAISNRDPRWAGVMAARLLLEIAINRLSTKWLVSTICLVTS